MIFFQGSSIRKPEINEKNLDKTSTEIIFRTTDDIVRIKYNKYYFIGRKNHIIKRFGHRIFLNKIEKLVLDSTNLIQFVYGTNSI